MEQKHLAKLQKILCRFEEGLSFVELNNALDKFLNTISQQCLKKDPLQIGSSKNNNSNRVMAVGLCKTKSSSNGSVNESSIQSVLARTLNSIYIDLHAQIEPRVQFRLLDTTYQILVGLRPGQFSAVRRTPALVSDMQTLILANLAHFAVQHSEVSHAKTIVNEALEITMASESEFRRKKNVASKDKQEWPGKWLRVILFNNLAAIELSHKKYRKAYMHSQSALQSIDKKTLLTLTSPKTPPIDKKLMEQCDEELTEQHKPSFNDPLGIILITYFHMGVSLDHIHKSDLDVNDYEDRLIFEEIECDRASYYFKQGLNLSREHFGEYGFLTNKFECKIKSHQKRSVLNLTPDAGFWISKFVEGLKIERRTKNAIKEQASRNTKLIRSKMESFGKLRGGDTNTAASRKNSVFDINEADERKNTQNSNSSKNTVVANNSHNNNSCSGRNIGQNGGYGSVQQQQSSSQNLQRIKSLNRKPSSEDVELTNVQKKFDIIRHNFRRESRKLSSTHAAGDKENTEKYREPKKMYSEYKRTQTIVIGTSEERQKNEPPSPQKKLLQPQPARLSSSGNLLQVKFLPLQTNNKLGIGVRSHDSVNEDSLMTSLNSRDERADSSTNNLTLNKRGTPKNMFHQTQSRQTIGTHPEQETIPFSNINIQEQKNCAIQTSVPSFLDHNCNQITPINSSQKLHSKIQSYSNKHSILEEPEKTTLFFNSGNHVNPPDNSLKGVMHESDVKGTRHKLLNEISDDNPRNNKGTVSRRVAHSNSLLTTNCYPRQPLHKQRSLGRKTVGGANFLLTQSIQFDKNEYQVIYFCKIIDGSIVDFKVQLFSTEVVINGSIRGCRDAATRLAGVPPISNHLIDKIINKISDKEEIISSYQESSRQVARDYSFFGIKDVISKILFHYIGFKDNQVQIWPKAPGLLPSTEAVLSPTYSNSIFKSESNLAEHFDDPEEAQVVELGPNMVLLWHMHYLHNNQFSFVYRRAEDQNKVIHISAVFSSNVVQNELLLLEPLEAAEAEDKSWGGCSDQGLPPLYLKNYALRHSQNRLAQCLNRLLWQYMEIYYDQEQESVFQLRGHQGKANRNKHIWLFQVDENRAWLKRAKPSKEYPAEAEVVVLALDRKKEEVPVFHGRFFIPITRNSKETSDIESSSHQNASSLGPVPHILQVLRSCTIPFEEYKFTESHTTNPREYRLKQLQFHCLAFQRHYIQDEVQNVVTVSLWGIEQIPRYFQIEAYSINYLYKKTLYVDSFEYEKGYLAILGDEEEEKKQKLKKLNLYTEGYAKTEVARLFARVTEKVQKENYGNVSFCGLENVLRTVSFSHEI